MTIISMITVLGILFTGFGFLISIIYFEIFKKLLANFYLQIVCLLAQFFSIIVVANIFTRGFAEDEQYALMFSGMFLSSIFTYLGVYLFNRRKQ